MMDDILNAVRALLELGSPAVYLIIVFTLWKENRRLTDLIIELMRERRGNGARRASNDS